MISFFNADDAYDFCGRAHGHVYGYGANQKYPF
jgi:hypothetical protein